MRGPLLVEGLHVGPLHASLQEINRFALEGKSAIHYAVLALAVALPIFTLVSLCSVSPHADAALAQGALVTGGPTRGDTSQPGLDVRRHALAAVHALILSGGFNKTELGPAILSIAVPLGAILFLLQEAALMARSRRGPRMARPGGEYGRPGRARPDHARYSG